MLFHFEFLDIWHSIKEMNKTKFHIDFIWASCKAISMFLYSDIDVCEFENNTVVLGA